MDDPLTISLVMTGVGMALLFAALSVLYGLMYLMTALIRDRDATSAPSESAEVEEAADQPLHEARLRAAAIAVALARAQTEVLGPTTPPVEASPWWTLHLHRQMTQQTRPRSIR